jgi:peroxiredoxin
MVTTARHFGIPDVELPRAGGGTLNPAAFAGHDLVVLFCPKDRAMAADELADYAARTSALVRDDAWIMAVCDEAGLVSATGQCPLPIAADPSGRAWTAFAELVPSAGRIERANGAVFLFGRGGCLRRVWSGSGQADEVCRELAVRTAAEDA